MTSGLAKLARAAALVPDPPCVGCPNWDRCAALKLACEQFFTYINPDVPLENATREPSRALFNRAFPKIDGTRAPIRLVPKRGTWSKERRARFTAKRLASNIQVVSYNHQGIVTAA